MIPPAILEACDFVLHFNSTIAHILGKMTNASDYSSGLETDPSEKIFLGIREIFLHYQLKSTLNQQELRKKTMIFATTMTLNCQLKLWQRKQEKRQKLETEPPVITLSHCHKNYNYTDTLIHNIELFTKDPHILIEQDADSVLSTFKSKLFGYPFDKQILTENPDYSHYNKKTAIQWKRYLVQAVLRWRWPKLSIQKCGYLSTKGIHYKTKYKAKQEGVCKNSQRKITFHQ